MVQFHYEKVSDRVTRIFGISGEMWYLVEGNEKAALLDTGSGIGHMKPLIAELTEKPVIILLTHGHVDHASGAPEFDCDTYMCPADEPVFQQHKTLEKRKEGLFMVPKEIVDQIEESDYIPQRTRPFLPLQAGNTFDLGGITVETYACPGHTPGSVVFLLREERMLLLGDACNFFTFMFFDYCDPIEVYRQTLVNLKAQLDGKYNRILLSHGDGNAPMEIIDNVIQVCDDIMAGQVDDVPFSFMGESAIIAKAMGPQGRLDGIAGNIVYRKENVWKRK